MELGTKQIDLGVWGVTDRGRVRTGNQDHFLAAELAGPGPGVRLDPDTDPSVDSGSLRVPLGPGGALLLLADGMGGAAGGDVASRLAVESVIAAMERASSEDSVETVDTFSVRLRDAVVEAHARLQAFSADRPWLNGMGTTLTAVGVLEGSFLTAQVGDSRAYLLRAEQLSPVTRDQTWVQEMIDSGAMTPEEARTSSRKGLLVQALGATSNLTVPLSRHDLRPGDLILLCSDGLSGVLTDEEIARTLLAAGTLREACEALVHEANEVGGPDNITALVAEPLAR